MRILILFILTLISALGAAAYAKTSVVVVQGLAGEDYYQRHFDEQVEKIAAASSNVVADSDIYIFGASESEQANKETVLASVQTVLESASAEDLLLVYLIGHGSYDGRDYKFNISGADISGADILETFSNETVSASVVVINTSSSSGALLKQLEQSNIHLISATKSGAERTATRFGRHFADGLLSAEADINKNQSISLQEAFNFAERETAAFYTEEGLLATENPQMQMVEGKSSADQIRLASLQSQAAAAVNSEVAFLYEQRDEIDRQIDTLRLRRINMTDEEYLQSFQDLMIQLSILQSQIDAESEAGSAESGT